MNRDTQRMLLIVAALLLWSGTASASNKFGVKPRHRYGTGKPIAFSKKPSVLENAGARIYDALHPTERSQDLPGKALSKQQLLTLATKTGFADPKLAAAIAMAESAGIPNALKRSSKEYSVGLWQINTMKHPYTVDDMRDPGRNARAAWEISKGGRDWHLWPTFTHGTYLMFKTGVLA